MEILGLTIPDMPDHKIYKLVYPLERYDNKCACTLGFLNALFVVKNGKFEVNEDFVKQLYQTATQETFQLKNDYHLWG